MSSNRVIGVQGKLPWHIPEDLARLHQLTKGHCVLMGRKTYNSLPKKIRPLPDRVSLVVSRSPATASVNKLEDSETEKVRWFSCLDDAKDWYLDHYPEKDLWVFGGGEIYSATMNWWDEMWLTLVKKKVEGDAYLTPFEDHFDEISCEDRGDYLFLTFKRK